MVTLIAPTADRVVTHTSDAALTRIHEEMQQRVEYLSAHPHEIPRRLEELDREWDIERCLATGSATFTLTGLLLGTTVDRRWLWLSAIVQGFFVQHALQGWCPPLPVFRALGVRTAGEIDQERYALKALLGDFQRVETGDAHSALRAADTEALAGARA
jgi:hypothetical protein